MDAGLPVIVPEITFGLTVIDFDAGAGALHPVTVYNILTVPADTPVTTPVPEFTVAIAVFELLQIPPAFPLLV